MFTSPPSLASELIVREGPLDGAFPTTPSVLFVLPLFEEANRLRRTIRLAMRALAERNIPSLLPDLPGQNESLAATQNVSLSLWADALHRIAVEEKRPIVTAAIRGGALIDQQVHAACRWRLAPVTGTALLRQMMTARIASDRETGTIVSRDALLLAGKTMPLDLAGNRISPEMIRELQEAKPVERPNMRTVELGTDTRKIQGSALWLRAEPGEDAAMAQAMAQDIEDWIRTCGVI